MSSDDQFIPPSSIKQIGSIGDGIKIYMEDYAATYIQQYAAADKNREKIAVLAGRYQTIDDNEAVFVSGVIQGKYAARISGMTVFTEKSMQYIEKQMEQYFSGCQIIGWVYVQPGFEDYINDSISTYQKQNEDKGFRLLYLTDPLEGVSSFYEWDKSGNVFNPIKGYIIYYDKNEGMHEYMLENKLKPINTTPELEMPERADAGAKARKAAAKPAVKQKIRRKNTSSERNMINMLGAVSFVMLLVCMVMGAGLIQNSERLSSMESKLNRLQEDFNGTKSVFAAQTTAAEPATQAVSQDVTQTTTQTQPQTQPQVQTQTQAQAQLQPVYETYTVENGDTLTSISQKFYGNGDRAEEIQSINNKSTSTIFPGEVIKLP